MDTLDTYLLIKVGLVGKRDTVTVNCLCQWLARNEAHTSSVPPHPLIILTSDTVNKAKQLLKEILNTDFDISNRVLRERMDQYLVNIFGSEVNVGLWVDEMLRSSATEKRILFVDILVKGEKHIDIHIKVRYKKVKTLRYLAAMVVARCFKDEKDIDKLEDIPKSLLDDIKDFL
eukprot:GFUD01045590.1.p1 GENE.GFUD01045590.1~~GFUD01045590.1.p1  ORF type:complete len:174 (+),score=41.85 GFUD01045590.1:47-568(+)